MRRWLSAAAVSAREVAERPALWLPGAIVWTVGVGWLALIVGVARPPSVAELTFFGAGIFTSGAWPWNAAALGATAGVVVIAGFALAALGEAWLLRGRRTRSVDVARVFALALVAAAPVLVTALALSAAVVVVGPAEFNAPDGGNPIVRTVVRLTPFLLAALVAATVGAAVHAVAAREALRDRPVPASLAVAPRGLARAGAGGLLHAVAVMLARAAYLVLAALLLRVLWAPIGVRLESDGMDPGVALLLVGFVSIWLCLVLGGGALHAWGSRTWTRLLDARITDADGASQRMETRTGP